MSSIVPARNSATRNNGLQVGWAAIGPATTVNAPQMIVSVNRPNSLLPTHSRISVTDPQPQPVLP